MCMANIEEKIREYLKGLPLGTLNLSGSGQLVVVRVGGGDYNLNFKISAGDTNFLLRLNVESQSGLENQIEYEYKTLQFLSSHNIAPHPLYLDNSKKLFEQGLLIEEFIKGKTLVFSVEVMKRTARTLAKLHTIPIAQASFFMKWSNPLRQQFEAVNESMRKYRQRKTANHEIIQIGDAFLKSMREKLASLESFFSPKSIIHTDLVPSNFVDDDEDVFLLDWEKARIDDPSYDIAVFFSRLANLWDSPRVLTDEEKTVFLSEYVSITKDETIQDRTEKRLALSTLHGILWAAGRISDVEEGVISEQLGSQNYERYKKIIDIQDLQKFL